MTLDNMTGITEGSYTGFCKSQLITCNFVKTCNGVCPFEDALKHADKEQSLNEQNNDHDRDWIIGCIEHDGFIKTDRFDKANQIILDALSAEPTCKNCKDLISRADAIEAIESRQTEQWIDADVDYNNGLESAIAEIKALPSAEAEWIPCSERLPEKDELVLVTVWDGVSIAWRNIYGGWESAEDMYEKGDVTAWMPLPKPYREDGE